MTDIADIKLKEISKSSNWNEDDPMVDENDIVKFQIGTGSLSFAPKLNVTGKSTLGTSGLKDLYDIDIFDKEKDLNFKELEGEVEEIKDNLALVIFNIDSIYEERLIPIKRLQAVNADFEGARIKLIIEDLGNQVTSRLMNISDIKKPLWFSPDEDIIRIFNKRNKQ